tara:strand:- start:43 stop:336 length:294 start_codon:yes stop_codon:yes gene_type:complete
MIVGKIARAVLKLILPDVTEHLLKVFKMDKLLNYMELPNEADRGVLKLQDELNMVKAELKNIAKIAHPPKDLLSKEELDDIKSVIKKVKNMRKFKIG